VRLRLYHHPDGARIAYRELGAGPPLALLHSAMLSHLEWEPLVEHLAGRFRVVLPDLPLHGDSEDDPSYPYTIDWFAELLCGFAAQVLGPRPVMAGHDIGAEILLHAIGSGRLSPARVVLMPNRLHLPEQQARLRSAARIAVCAGAVPGIDRALARAAPHLFNPSLGPRLSARAQPGARDLVRHAFADAPGNPGLARAWAKFARHWPRGAQTQLVERVYPRLQMPVLLLWADRDRLYPLGGAEATLELLAQADLRVLSATGFLMAYDDPVGVARELSAFCR
jgi:pimeloyl-ACP methyl ester carboxylesterase